MKMLIEKSYLSVYYIQCSAFTQIKVVYLQFDQSENWQMKFECSEKFGFNVNIQSIECFSNYKSNICPLQYVWKT